MVTDFSIGAHRTFYLVCDLNLALIGFKDLLFAGQYGVFLNRALCSTVTGVFLRLLCSGIYLHWNCMKYSTVINIQSMWCLFVAMFVYRLLL